MSGKCVTRTLGGAKRLSRFDLSHTCLTSLISRHRAVALLQGYPAGSLPLQCTRTRCQRTIDATRQEEQTMPEDAATHSFTEIVGFEPTAVGCVLVRLRSDQGKETRVKVPRELLGRLTYVTTSAYHTLVQPVETPPTSADDISGGRPFGSLENVGIT